MDPKTIDLDNYNWDPRWILFDKPVTNFLHQIMLHDHCVSTGDKILHDTVPPKYLFQPEEMWIMMLRNGTPEKDWDESEQTI